MAQARSTKEPSRHESTSRQGSKEEKNQASMQSAGSERGQQSLERRNAESSAAAWNPFSFMRRFSEEMDRLFEDFGYGRNWPALGSSGFGGGLMPRGQFGPSIWSPQIEMFERGEELVVRADLPGLNKNDIKIQVADDCLTIEGERRQEQEENQEGRYHSERRYGRFYRCIELPRGVDADDINASFHDGVLEVTLPKPQSESSGRRIEIRDSAASKASEKK